MGASPTEQGRGGRLHLVRYAAGWIVAGAIVAVIVVAFVRSDADERISLPPVRQTELTAAARDARCELRAPSPTDELYAQGTRRALSRAARAGTYERPPAPEALIEAVRRGIIVIQYDLRLPDEEVGQLETLQRAVPNGTIVTPLAVRARYRTVVTAYRRTLGCPDLSRTTIDAIRLFRGRFIGSGSTAER